MNAKSLCLFQLTVIATVYLCPQQLISQTVITGLPSAPTEYISRAATGNMTLVDSLALPRPELWRQTAGVQQVGRFIIVEDIVLQQEGSMFADQVLSVIDAEQRTVKTINISELPGNVPGKGYFGAAPVGRDLLIRYSDGFIRYEFQTGKRRQFYPDRFEERYSVFPMVCVCNLAQAGENRFLIPVTSYDTGRTSFALCDSTGNILKLQEDDLSSKPCRSYYRKSLYSAYSITAKLHAALESDEMRLTLKPLFPEDEHISKSVIDLKALLQESFQILEGNEKVVTADFYPIGMSFEDTQLSLLFRDAENPHRKLLLVYDYTDRSALIFEIDSSDIFAFSWDQNRLTAITDAASGEDRLLKIYSYSVKK